MSDSLDLELVEKRIRRSVNQDGLTYLALAVILFCVGLSLLDNRLAVFAGLSALVMFPVESLRQRITYPRIGYVRFAVPSSTVRGILGFAALAVGVLTFFAFFAGGALINYLPLVISLVFVISVYGGLSMQGLRPRDRALLTIMVASGIIFTVLLDDWHRAAAAQMWLVVPLLILLGLVDLITFLRRYPIIPDDGQ